jgi:hypothetical protein
MTADINDYLEHYDYNSIEQWALDSGYRYEKHTDTWFDEEGDPVSIEEKLQALLDD